MIRFFRAHGYDPLPTQRPLLAGSVTGLLATVPAGLVLFAFGSFEVAADEVIRLPGALTAALMLLAFTLAGLIYGGFFQRAANDRKAGWMLGLAYGFLLWIAAPMVVLPLVRGDGMAAGLAATGFFVAFLLWGLATGVLFPVLHRRLHADLAPGSERAPRRFGPDAARLKQRLLRRSL